MTDALDARVMLRKLSDLRPPKTRRPPSCRRCGAVGHYAKTCRRRPDVGEVQAIPARDLPRVIEELRERQRAERSERSRANAARDEQPAVAAVPFAEVRPAQPVAVFLDSGGCGKHCRWCFDLPHRRPPDGCPGCLGPYQAEKIERPEHRGESAIARAENW